jgi:hypothetical protein
MRRQRLLQTPKSRRGKSRASAAREKLLHSSTHKNLSASCTEDDVTVVERSSSHTVPSLNKSSKEAKYQTPQPLQRKRQRILLDYSQKM